MLESGSNLKEIRLFLKERIGEIHSSQETESIIKIIFDHSGLNYMDSFSHPDLTSNPEIISQIKEIVEEIANNRPIQYILGYAFFYNLKLLVNSKVLIPRPETEELVDRIIKSSHKAHSSVLDIGTGSGCIAIALKTHLPDAELHAIDMFPEALSVAKKNAENNGAAINFMQIDFLDNPAKVLNLKVDIIVSNPPYVRHSEKEVMEPNVLENEPWNALFVDDSNPLLFYRAIADYAGEFLNKQGDIWLEINEKYGMEIKKLFKDKGFPDSELHKDMQGKERIFHVKAT